MRPLTISLIVILALGIGAAGGWFVHSQQIGRPAPLVIRSPDLAGFEVLEDRLRQTRARFERLRPPTSDEEYALRRPRTPSYSEHREAADSLGVEPIEGEADIRRHLAAGRLVPLTDTEFYTVRILEHSAPFVTPATHARLAEIGRRFQADLEERGLPKYRYTISSVARTAELQADLSQSNRNAVSGNSTHEYGVTVDIVIFRYDYLPTEGDGLDIQESPAKEALDRVLFETYDAYGSVYWDHLFGSMTRVLGQMQREGVWLVLLESEQPVFHLTLAG